MKTFAEFAAAMRQQESGNDYNAVNKFGYLGAYQFGKPRLYDLGYSIDGFAPANRTKRIIIAKDYFLSKPELQDVLFEQHCRIWRNYVTSRYAGEFGTVIKGVTITISGMVAGIHLLGLGNKKNPGLVQFLNEGIIGKDGNKTPITEYIKKFADYDMSTI
jgi:hypothetical protein